MMAARPQAPLRAPEPLTLSRTALFLDLDGTLAPLAAKPDAVVPDARMVETLRRLDQALEGRLAIVSGRPLSAVDAILENAVRACAGVHGLEHRTAGRVERTPPHPALKEARLALAAFAATAPGIVVEDKGPALAVHYRQAPAAGPEVAALAEALAVRTGLELQPGAMVYELKTPGTDKGQAVEAFMSEPPFLGARPVFVGDDLTDEAGFAAVAALGGVGVLVGPPRPTRAERGLPGPAAVLQWLEASLA